MTYVAKNQILTEHQVFRPGSSRKSSGQANVKGYFYREKKTSNELSGDAKDPAAGHLSSKPGVASLFGHLAADPTDGPHKHESDEDEDA